MKRRGTPQRTRLSRKAEQVVQGLLRLPRSYKRALMLASDAFFISVALWTSLSLKLGGVPQGLGAEPALYVTALVASIPIFVRLGLYRAVIRFLSARAIMAVTAGVTASVVVLAVVNLLAVENSVPFSALVIYWVLAMAYVGGSRMFMRNMLNVRAAGVEPVVIYGAGSAGAQAAVGLRSGGVFHPIAFIDDDVTLHRSSIAGIEVHGPKDLGRLVEQDDIRTILLALPSQTRRRRQQILKSLEPFPVRVMTVPDRTATAFQLDVPAADLKPGLYTCQVNVIDDAAGAFAFPRFQLYVRK